MHYYHDKTETTRYRSGQKDLQAKTKLKKTQKLTCAAKNSNP